MRRILHDLDDIFSVNFGISHEIDVKMVTLTLVSYIIRGLLALIVFKPIVEWCLKRRKYVQTVNKIPGLKGYPLIGSIWLSFNLKREDIVNIALSRPKLYPGGISRAWLGPFPEVRVDTGKLTILQNQKRRYFLYLNYCQQLNWRNKSYLPKNVLVKREFINL